MSISRRKLLGLLPTLSVGFVPVFNTESRSRKAPVTVFGYQLDDDVSLSLLKCYARSLALKDSNARWEAQMMFHEAQLARRNGGTLSHKLGYRHEGFVVAHERGVVQVENTSPLWR